MSSFLQIIVFVFSGVILLWFGYTLFFRLKSGVFFSSFFNKQKSKGSSKFSKVGAPQICPVCSKKLTNGERVKSASFPAFAGSKERLVHISGCYYCLEKGYARRCPVCKASLNTEDFLISKMFEKDNTKNHIHVVGCNLCKKTGS